MVPMSSSVNSRLSPCSFVSGFFTTLYSTCICKCMDFRVPSVHYKGKGKGYSQKVVREGVIRGRGLSSLFRQPQKAKGMLSHGGYYSMALTSSISLIIALIIS